MSSYKCPICGSQGIPAYDKEDVICPCCNSDLRIYRVLSEIAASSDHSVSKGSKLRKWILVMPAIFVVLTLAFVLITRTNTTFQPSVTEKTGDIALLRDSLDVLKAQLSCLGGINASSADSGNVISYYVVHGDSPWGIVKKVLGVSDNWSEIAMQIAKDNQMWDYEKEKWLPIYPGQVIKINLNR